MILNTYIPLRSFINGWSRNKTDIKLVLSAVNLMHTFSFEDYGLGLLRRAIGLYEQKMNIHPDNSKQAIPFFRENRRMLVGPEMEMYIISMYENDLVPLYLQMADSPILKISLDYESLAEYCLLENLYLIRCKYDEELSLQTFVKQLEREYDKFFFDEEHTGFTADSRFFSMLCNACMEVKRPEKMEEKEWNVALFRHPSEAEYGFVEGKLTPFISIPVPVNCIKRISLLNKDGDILSFSALAGFLQSKGLAPELYLEGLIEE